MRAGITPLGHQFSLHAELVGASVIATDDDHLPDVIDGAVGPVDSLSVGVSVTARDLLPETGISPDTREVWPEVAISLAPLGVAATGSVVLAEQNHHDRLMALLCDRHIVLLRAATIVPTPDNVLPWMRESGNRYVTFITGPSRTSDIERILTIGVHGPRELVIVVVG